MNFVKYSKTFLSFSMMMMVLSIVAIFSFGYNTGIDFKGGTAMQVELGAPKDQALPAGMTLEHYLSSTYKDVTGQETAPQKSLASGESETSATTRYQLRSVLITNEQKTAWLNKIREVFPEVKELSFETVSPTIGSEIIRKSVFAIIFTLIAILLYLAYAFRRVPRPTSSWQFGAAAVITLLVHDVVVLLGVYSVLSHFFGAEVDSMFITALLTLLGFSVHDTIVTFDRLRENLIHKGGANFEHTVNNSITETVTRSLATSFTMALVLLAMTLLGGETTFFFTMALLVGVILGTYSSICVASPLLLLWHNKGKATSK
jgi:preprotein translocase subunit SecF